MISTKFATVEDEYLKNRDLNKSDVQLLQQWAQSQLHLPPISDFELILFLHSCFSSIQLAKKTIDVFFTLKTHCPELFSDKAIDTKPKDFFDVSLIASLPKLTPDNYRVIYMKLIDLDSSKYNFNDQIKIFDMVMTLELRQQGTQRGFILVFDLEKTPFSIMTRLSLLSMKKLIYYLQEGVPIRLKGIHFINIIPFVDKLMALIKPFIKQNLFATLHLHENIDTLIKFVPQECLPKDLGGTVDSISELHEKMKNNLRENADYFIMEQQRLVDESKRPGKPKSINSIFGVEGSFKKLDLD